MNTIFFTLLGAVSASSTYRAVLQALVQGRTVRYFQNNGGACAPAFSFPFIGGTLRTWERFYDARFGPQDYFASGDARLIQLPSGDFVWRQVTLRAYANDSATLEVLYSDPLQRWNISDGTFTVCTMGIQGGGITLAWDTTPAAAPKQIDSLPSVMTALMSGYTVRQVVQYASCALDGQTPSVNATAGDVLDMWEFQDGGASVTWGRTALIYNYQARTRRDSPMVYDMVSAQAWGSNSSVLFTAQDVNPGGTDAPWKPVYQETLNCTFNGNGGAVTGVSFFLLPG